MPKIDINQAAEILKRNSVEPSVIRQIVEEMQAVIQAETDPDKPPPVKKQFCIVISDPEGRLPADEDFAGWVVQIPEDAAPPTTEERIHRATYEFNASKRGRLLPAKSVGEALENVSAKFFKEAGLWVKTKTPVLMLKTNNKIPDETSEKDARWGRG